MREILHADLLGHQVDGTFVESQAQGTEGLGSSELRGRMELEHERALRERTPLAVMRIAVDQLERLAQTVGGGKIEFVLASVTSVLRTLPRKGDLLAVREQDEIVAVLTQTDAAAAESLARALQQGAARLMAPGASTPLGMRLSIGLACAQFETPCWFQTLLAVAQEGVEVAWGAGGGRVVHSELYSLHQRRLERLSPDRPKPVLPPETKRSEPQAHASPLREIPAKVAAPAIAPVTPPAALPQIPGIHALEERVLSLAREWTEEALSKALAESHKAHSSEVDTMQRRIDKLSRALEDAQGELVRVQEGQEIDPGVASAFRTVQGLRDSNGTSAKRDMLSQLFEANLELRTLLGRQS
jgi:GGDEF domain-containing protein